MYPGIRRFPDGRDFKQWTEDDSKASMKVRFLFFGTILFTYIYYEAGLHSSDLQAYPQGYGPMLFGIYKLLLHSSLQCYHHI